MTEIEAEVCFCRVMSDSQKLLYSVLQMIGDGSLEVKNTIKGTILVEEIEKELGV